MKSNLREEIKPHIRIRKIIIKRHPKEAREAKKLFRFKYPKLFVLGVIIILSYILFKNPQIVVLISSLKNDPLSVFISGILMSFGFSAPIAIGFFIISQPESIIAAAVIGGFGAMVGDLIIFKLIKFSFMDEFKRLEKEKTIIEIENIVKNHTPTRIRHYLLYIFAGIFLVTPLPDEVGVSMLAGISSINEKFLALISFILHTATIYAILVLSVA